jgi:hypothetical protein
MNSTRDSSLSIVTGYGLYSLGSIPGKGKTFFSPASRLVLWPTQPPVQCVPGAILPEVDRPWRKADHPPPSSVEA